MEELLLTHYQIQVKAIEELEGYISHNYKVIGHEANYVLKVYPNTPRVKEEVLGEIALVRQLDHLNSRQISTTIPNKNTELLSTVSLNGKECLLQLMSYIEGTFLAETTHTPQLFESFGQFLGHMDQRLINFENSAIASRRLVWNLDNFELATPLAQYIAPPSKKKLVDHYIIEWRQHVAHKLPHLRHSIIYNDANDWNVLVHDSAFGIIDFGDASYSALINEVAIACTYALMNKEEPLKWASYLVKGYHSVMPLQEEELNLLYYLIAGRLVTSVCKSAEQAKAQPHNTYIQISEEGAWKLLEKWITIGPVLAENTFREACSYSPKSPPPLENQINNRHKFISKGLSISYNTPIHMESAIFQYMFDRHGNRFLDAYNNIPHVGHQHPKVVEAAQRQIAKLNTNTRYLYDALPQYAEKLLSKFPDHLNRVFFVNSGSAASDLAIRLAQNFTSRTNIGVVQHGYHGNTRTGIQISPYKYMGKGGTGRAENIVEAELPDSYRGRYRGASAGEAYAQDYINHLSQGKPLAAFIAEPIVGCGGQVPLANGFLRKLVPHLRNSGSLYISDEVQTGFGRMGSHYWGFQMHEVSPDIVVLGKPIGNGHPMAAVVCTQAIADAFDNGMEFFSSFGGNPVSCEIGLAVLETIEEEGLQKNALEVGNYKKDLFTALAKQFPQIGDIRGSGLFLGLEIIADDDLTPHTQLASVIKNELRNRHILVSTDGPHDNVIKSKPPMCFNKTNAEELVSAMHEILTRNT